MGFKQFFFIFIIFALFYAVVLEPEFITIKKIKFNSDDMPKLKIVFISDLHLSKFSKNRLLRIIKKVNAQNPDIVISGGDYYIMHRANMSMDTERIASEISGIKTKYGIYSVLGNHDSYGKKDAELIKSALLRHGVYILENSNVKLNIGGKNFYLAGISDMQTTHYDLNKALKETEKPVILVSHSPDITPSARGKVNLILSGHTHGGQVRFPFFGALIVPSVYGQRYVHGFVESIVYITKGLGTSLFRIRFNCVPEIVVIEYN